MARKLPVFLLGDEPERLLRAARTERDRVLGLCLVSLGLRAGEVCRLRVEHLDFARRLLWVRRGKGDKDRCLPLPRVLLGPLRGWVGARREGCVFPSRQGGGPLTVRALEYLVKRLAARAALPDAGRARRYHPHALRHVFATRALEAGGSLYDVKELLGHSDIRVTEKYLFSTPGRLEGVVNAVYGGK